MTSSQDAINDAISQRNVRHRNEVRWYLMIYPYGRKGITLGLDREIARRKRDNEPSIEYFAPTYVEAKEVDNRIVNTEKQLLFNYVFVRASENELFRMKKFEEQYNFPHRYNTDEGEQYYPYISDEMMQNLQWIARSYSGTIPVFTGDSSWLVKGDRILITKGQFKGVEAQLFSNKKTDNNEILVVIDKWLSVPLLHVKAGEYKVIALNSKTADDNSKTINDSLIPLLHAAVCRGHKRETTEDDITLAQDAIRQYKEILPYSDVMRCKQYSILLMAYTVLHNEEKLAGLTGVLTSLLPAITAEQSKALLITTLYGCTDNSIYHHQAHQIVDRWKQESNLKKSKQLLIRRLADYDSCLGH